MKTLRTLFLLVIILTGQLSYGTGNENCCPDTTNARILAASTQMQLDEVQLASNQADILVPTLAHSVTAKLMSQRTMLEQVQMETERLEDVHAWPLRKQLETKLRLRVQHAGQDSTEDAIIKL